jgi:acyl carrier protein
LAVGRPSTALVVKELEVPAERAVPSASFVDDHQGDSLAVVELVAA